MQVERVPEDEGFLSLLAEIHKNNIKGHIFRGYAILDGKIITKEVAVSIWNTDHKDRPLNRV